jgi:prolyl oligopeptidase
MRRSLLAVLPALLAPALASCTELAPAEPPHAAAAPPPAAPPPTAPAPPAPGGGAQKPSRYPATAKRPVTNEYHGTRVVDDYQWLESTTDPEVQRWIGEQARRTRAHLDAIAGRKGVRDGVARILQSIPANWFSLEYKGGRLFALKFQPPKQQPFLVLLKSPDDPASERVLVDPVAFDAKGRTSIDWYVPSLDGKKVAVSLSDGGTENGTVHVFDVDTGKDLGDSVPYANTGTAGGALTWTGDGKGFYYTRHPHPGERPAADMGFYQQIYFHKLGTKASDDVYSLGKDFVRIAESFLATSENGKFVLASVQNGDGGEWWQWVLDDKGRWTKFADLSDQVVHAEFGADNKLYLLSRKDAPRGKILRIDPAKPDLAKAEALVPEGEATIEGYEATRGRLFVTELYGGPSQLRVLDLKGKAIGQVPTLPVSSVQQVVHLAGDDVLFRNQSYTEPPAWYAYRAQGGKVTKTALATTLPVSFADAEVVREMCTSKDGTKVPVSILRRKGAPLDGSSPALLTAYGGYGVSLTPGPNPLGRLWLDRGGVFAVANLRGGGEFGEAWHRGGNLTKKQNVFDDFYACAKLLVDAKYTKPDRLAIIGGSNGGLLMGAALTQHPEMYRAVVSFVGIYDMLRVELTPNGAFNVTEYGSVKDPEQWKALRAYSPYHNVKDGVAYPAVFFLTGANDPRVDPFHSRKMAARLQAATTGGVVLLRPAEGTGHGMGTPLDDRIEEMTDVYTFLFNELGMPEPAAK